MQEEVYLLELTRYIHLNPIRAKLVGGIGELDAFKYCGHGVVMVLVQERLAEGLHFETVRR